MHLQIQKKVSDKRNQNNLSKWVSITVASSTNPPDSHLPPFCGTIPLVMWCDCRRRSFSFQKLSLKEPLIILVPKAFVFWNFLEIHQPSSPKMSCWVKAWFNKQTRPRNTSCSLAWPWLLSCLGIQHMPIHVVGIFLRVKTKVDSRIFLASKRPANFWT